jgi:hypothetical protein
MAAQNLPSFPLPGFAQLIPQQLQALSDAHDILNRAEGEVASFATTLPFRFVHDARMYVARQADALLQPIFAAPISIEGSN